MEYDDLYRLTRIDNTYKVQNGIAPWRSPFEAEANAGDHRPVPLRDLPTRIANQTFHYDGLGNLTASSDDLSARYDRSLGGGLGYGTPEKGPNQLRSGDGFQVHYDDAGNLTELKVERPGKCRDGKDSRCAQWFTYDWDEVGQLARARRWDFDGNALPSQGSSNSPTSGKPAWDLTYAYSLGARVRKSATDNTGASLHTLEIYDTLRVERAPFDKAKGNYQASRENMHVYPGRLGHVFWDTQNKLVHQAPDSKITMHLVMGDQLGSSSVVINHANSELVERTTYQPYGAVESDYRSERWNSFREDYKFTGKEEDIEVGATYFGARYYQPYLGRFMSADPLTIHGLGSDLNPYAYVSGQVTTSVDPFGLERWEEVPCTGGESVCYEIIDDPPQPAPQPKEPTAEKHANRDPIFFARGPISDSEYGFELFKAEVDRIPPPPPVTDYLKPYAPGLRAATVYWIKETATDLADLNFEKAAFDALLAQANGWAATNATVLPFLVDHADKIVAIAGVMKPKIYVRTVAPGPYANKSIPLRGPGRDFNSEERAGSRELGPCHTCGTWDFETKYGDPVLDHQPPVALAGPPYRGFPQCANCGLIKPGGKGQPHEVNKIKNRK